MRNLINIGSHMSFHLIWRFI